MVNCVMVSPIPLPQKIKTSLASPGQTEKGNMIGRKWKRCNEQGWMEHRETSMKGIK